MRSTNSFGRDAGYTLNDAAGRRIICAKSGSAFSTPDTYDYRYNARSELTNATAAVDSAYRFDDIGNWNTASERGANSVYTANSLNQYTAVNDFVPQFDDDGNQTRVKTATGVWQVTYNGENRPVRWERIGQSEQSTNLSSVALAKEDRTILSMSYDRMGRRVTKNDKRFVYNGYLQVADNNGNAYVWDSTEPVATRPLVWRHAGETLFYVHDGNKNVSEVVASDGTLAAHYEYAPFGAVTVQTGAFAEPNPWRFSGEYADVEAGGIYFNFRNYTPETGRWFAGDPVGEIEGVGIYGFCGNRGYGYCDILGLWSSVWPWDTHQDMVEEALNTISKDFLESVPCLRDDDVKDYLLRKIIAGNVGMDSNKDYNRSTPGMLPYHFNRFESEDQTAIEAILLYKKNLALASF